jgi:hypothetical protein
MAKKTKEPTQISIAKIGLIGVIVAAVIGLCGTIIASYVGYLSIRAQIEEPIHATQTAQANLLSLSLPTPAPQSNTPSQSTPPISNNSSPANTDWQNFLDVDTGAGCGTLRVLPIAINPNGNIAEQIANTNLVKSQDWTIIPGYRFLLLNSIASNDWIKIGKSLNVSVSTNSTILAHVDVVDIQGCGGTGQVRVFSSINLRSDLRSFTQESTFSGADFFTLQPGEFEVFEVPFECKAFGYYSISVSAEYTYQGESGVVEFPKFNALCPQTFTSYSVTADGSLIGVENYAWKNGEYSQTP